MPEALRHFYVYYAVAPESAAVAKVAVADLLAQVQAVTGVGGHLRRRADDPGLWMEIYEGVAARSDFPETLHRLRAATALPGCLVPGKTFHTECFQDFDA